MAENREQRSKRMAQALRENLKRRKAQRRDINADSNSGAGEHRLFRDKPVNPEKNKPI